MAQKASRFKMQEAVSAPNEAALRQNRLLSRSSAAICTTAMSPPTQWAKSALDDLFSGRWPAVIGFCWWNESWENDDNKKHDTDMNILHDASLTNVFREELEQHADKIQEAPILSQR